MAIFSIFEEEAENVEEEEVDHQLRHIINQINDPYQGMTKVQYYQNYYHEENDGDIFEIPKYPHINDVTTDYRQVVEILGNMSVLEYTIDLSYSENDPDKEYLTSMAGKKNRQLLINLDEDHDVIIRRGAMALTAGDIQHELNVTGINEWVKEKIRSKAFQEELIYTRWYGNGQLLLEPTDDRYILLLDIEEWGEQGIVVEKEMFLAADGDVDVNFKYVGKVWNGIFGGEGYFNVALKGKGAIALLNVVPMSELMLIDLQDEEVRIDGNFAVCWSSSLKFSVELSKKGDLVTSVLDREGKNYMVNVYRGTGKILVSPVANSIRSRRKNQRVKHLDEEYEE